MSAAPMALAQGAPSQNTATSTAAPPPATGGAGGNGAGANSGEITVTALRTATNIQKTPVAVTAFSGKGLQNQTFQSFVDITRIAPAVRFTGQGNVDGSSITMRGLGAPPAGTGGPAVQIYENDFNLQGFNQNVPTYDVANIQVLKGPQGTLFGRNTLGGAILYNTVQPSYSQSGYLQASLGNYNYWAIEGAGNITILPDVLALRVAGQVRRRDGYVTDIAQNFGYSSTLNKLANVNTDSFRASLLFTPTSKFKNVFTFEYLNGDETGSPSVLFSPTSFSPFYAFSGPEKAALQACNFLCVDYGNVNNIFFKRQHYTLMDTATYEISPNLSIKNIGGWSSRKDTIAIDTSATPSPIFLSTSFNPVQFWSDELQLLGHFDRFHWILGGFYQSISPGSGPDGGGSGLAGFSSTATYSTTKAIFFNLDTDLTDRLKLHTGVRYTWDNQRVCSLGSSTAISQPYAAAQTCALDAAAAPGTAAGILSESASAPTWLVGLDYQATDNLFFYVTSRRGYRSGGVNSPLFNTPCSIGAAIGPAGVLTPGTCQEIIPAGSPGGPAILPGLDFGSAGGGAATHRAVDLTPFQFIKPEYLTDFEIGFRSNWMIGGWRTRVNAQYFHYIYTNVSTLLQLGSPAVPPFSVLTPFDKANPVFGSVAYNGGELVADGVEGDVTVNPTHDLTLDVNVSYFTQKQTKTPTPPAGFTAAFFPSILLPTPKWALTASLNYVLPWHPANGDLVVNYNYFWTDSYLVQTGQLVPGYDLHNMRLEWNNIGRSNISAAFWMTNIFDKRYQLSPVYEQILSANVGEPRMLGVDLSVKFH